MPTKLFYLICLGVVGGVLLRSFLFIPIPVLLLSLVIAIGWLCLWRKAVSKDADHQVQFWLLSGAIILTALALGAFRFSWAELVLTNHSLVASEGQVVTLTGQVVREPDRREDSTLLTMKTADTKVLLQTDRFTPITYGDQITVTGELEKPTTFTTGLGRTFDYKGYLLARGVTHTVSFVTPTIIASSTGKTVVLQSLYKAKANFLQHLRLVLPASEVDLGAGLLLGVQSALGEELELTFRQAGLIHIVVLSGYNIMLVVVFVLYALSFLLPFRARLIGAIVAIVVFALLVGYAPSVVRASLMAILFLLAALLARPQLIIRLLVLAGTLMVLFNPYILRYDIGFQLSFMATLGLILTAPQLELLLTKVTTRFSVRTFLIATVVTQVAVAPLLLYHIGEWSLVAIPANILVLPMVPLAMLLTFGTGLIALVSTTLALPFALLADWSLTYIIFIAETITSLPLMTVTVPAFPGYLVGVMYLGLGLVWYRFFYQAGSRPLTVTNSSSPTNIAVTDDFKDWQIEPEAILKQRLQIATGITNPTDHVKQSIDQPKLDPPPIFFR